MNQNALKALLTELCTVSGISGNESAIAELACEKLKAYCPDAHIVQGNVIGSTGSDDPEALHILLDAHLDQIGLVVTEITEDGFVCVGNVGGLDYRWFPAQRVCLHGKKDIYGIVSTLPPHLHDGEEKAQKLEQIRIDTGYPAEELKKILSPGDSITFTGVTASFTENRSASPSLENLKKMLSHGEAIAELPVEERFTSPSLDDRSGMAAILYALDEIKNQKLDCKVSVLFSNREEVNGCGAKTGCFSINPDIALAVDVSFAGDGTKGTGEAGEGPMIGFSPSLAKDISHHLATLAVDEDIPYQYEVMSGRTGTNADDFSVCREGVSACTVSIPLFYMHTPVEVVSLTDIQNTGRLLAAFLRRCFDC